MYSARSARLECKSRFEVAPILRILEMEANQSRFLRHLPPEKDPKERSLSIVKEFRYSGEESPQNLKTNFYHFAQNETLNLMIWVVLGKDYTRKKFLYYHVKKTKL